MVTTLSAEDIIRRGIIDLQKPQPFFAHLVMRLRPKLMPKEMPMQTIGVDAKGELYYNEEFIKKVEREAVKGILCHEVLHVAFLHMLRTGGRNRVLANIAQDVVVNMMVKKAGMRLTDGAIPYEGYSDSSEFELNGMRIRINDVSRKMWEEVYEELLQTFHENKKPLPQIPCAVQFDEHVIGDGQQDAGQQEKWEQALVEAYTYAKQQGKEPEGMQRYVDSLLKPKVSWKGVLMKYLKQHTNPVDWSYQRPHRKSKVLETFLPTTIKEACEVEVLVDTSGSIGKAELTEFLTEIVAIAKSMNHVQMWVSSVDAELHTRYEVANGDIPKILAMDLVGGGGTDMEEGLDAVKRLNPNVPVVVVFTDGETSFNKRRKDYPFDVIWVVSKDGISHNAMEKIPYGVKIKMDG